MKGASLGRSDKAKKEREKVTKLWLLTKQNKFHKAHVKHKGKL